MATNSVQEQDKHIIDILIKQNPIRLNMAISHTSHIIQLMISISCFQCFTICKFFYDKE